MIHASNDHLHSAGSRSHSFEVRSHGLSDVQSALRAFSADVIRRAVHRTNRHLAIIPQTKVKAE